MLSQDLTTVDLVFQAGNTASTTPATPSRSAACTRTLRPALPRPPSAPTCETPPGGTAGPGDRPARGTAWDDPAASSSTSPGDGPVTDTGGAMPIGG
jgi:hypothetical protein